MFFIKKNLMHSNCCSSLLRYQSVFMQLRKLDTLIILHLSAHQSQHQNEIHFYLNNL